MKEIKLEHFGILAFVNGGRWKLGTYRIGDRKVLMFGPMRIFYHNT